MPEEKKNLFDKAIDALTDRDEKEAEKGLGLRGGEVRAELPLDLDGARLGRDDDARRRARRTLVGEDLARAVGDVLACHLDQAER